MRAMREHLRTHDIRAWARSYLTSLDQTGGLADRLSPA
jgi:trehalose 6-phosphate synthase